MKLKSIDLNQVLEKSDSVYEAIIAVARRSRMINDGIKKQYNELISSIAASSTDDDLEEKANPDQLRISLDIEKQPKPHIQAIKELLDGKIQYKYIE